MSEKFNLGKTGVPSVKINLIETIAGDERFSVLSRMMGSSGANAVLSAPGEFTVLAPTNDAFAKISGARMNELLNQKDQVDLKALLSYHILPGKLVAAKLAGLRNTRTVADGRVSISDTAGLKVNDSSIETRNIAASNGVIHAIDTVLAPPVVTPAARNTVLHPMATELPPSQIGVKPADRIF